jgi:hypothetical protein
MQLAGFSRRTVQIDLYRRGDRVGSVWVQDGFGYHAEDAKGTGQRALRRLLGATDVSIECRALAEDPTMPRTLDASCEELLVESMRFFDESAHHGTIEPDAPEADLPIRSEQAANAAREIMAEGRPPLPTLPSISFEERTTLPSGPGPLEQELQGEDVPGSFDDLYARGVDALLSHQYAEAFTAFLAASKLGTTTGLEANLARLRAMGYGNDTH